MNQISKPLDINSTKQIKQGLEEDKDVKYNDLILDIKYNTHDFT